jgi:hypothetical protein
MSERRSPLLRLLDEADRARHEARAVSEEGEEETDGELLVDHRERAEIGGEQQLQREEQILAEGQADAVGLGAVAGGDDVRIAVAPAIFAHRLVAVELDRPHRPKALHEIGFFARTGDDLLLRSAA